MSRQATQAGLTGAPRRPRTQPPAAAAGIRNDLLAGLVVALALIPEAIAFSIIAGVDPKVGLYASFCIAVIIAFTGGRPGMISAATAAMAVLMVTLVKEHGLQYLLAATVLTGVLQIVAGWLRLGSLMRFVSRSVITGFVNALAILIFMAQLPELIGVTWHVYAMTAAGLAIIYLLPLLTRAVPSPLVCDRGADGVAITLDLDIRTVGDMGELPDSLPVFLLPDMPLNLETLLIILPYSLTLAVVGLLESLMTATIVDDLTDTKSDKNRECVGQGVANIATGFIGGMAGCAMIGQSVINVKSGGRGRLSTFSAGVFLLLMVVFLGDWVGADPDGRAGGGDDHGLHRHLQLGFAARPAHASEELEFRDAVDGRRDRGHPRPRHGRAGGRAAVRVLLRPQGRADLPRALAGRGRRSHAHLPHLRPGVLRQRRPLHAAFDFREVIDHVRIDVSRAHFWDITAVSALDKVVMKFRREGTTVEVIGLNEASATMIDRFAVHDKPGSEQDLLLEH
jgi:SulP family sulfate permease